MRNKKRGVTLILVAVAVVVLAVAIYFTWFFSYSCKDLACYRAHQEKCSKTGFINDVEYTTWFYDIKGKSKGECEIVVRVLQIKEGTTDKMKLEGKEMICKLPLGDVGSPESDLSRCHGMLKEELQTIIIQELHSYIVENLGEISGEFENISG